MRLEFYDIHNKTIEEKFGKYDQIAKSFSRFFADEALKE